MDKRNKLYKQGKSLKTHVTIESNMTIMELAELVSQSVHGEDLPIFVAILDHLYEDWETTLKLVSHFKAVEQTYIEEVAENDEDKVIEVKHAIDDL